MQLNAEYEEKLKLVNENAQRKLLNVQLQH